MARLSVRVDGLTEAKSTVADLPQAFKDAVVRAIYFGSGIIGIEADRRVPVRSGKLKGSRGRNIRDDGLQAAVGYGDPKAKFLEFGTNDTAAQPFLYPAFRIGARYIRKSMRDWPDEAVQQARFKTKRGRRPKK